MKISFVIPAYNEEALLSTCLESILAEVARTGLAHEAEIIVVNNASTDRTREISLQYKGILVVDEPRKGLTRARQAGFLASCGELVANPDADTILPAGWLTTVLEEFERNPKLLALSGPYVYYDLSLVQRILVKIFTFFSFVIHLINYYLLRMGAIIQGGNFVVRRSALEAIGGHNTSIEFYGEDTDIAKRIAVLGKVKWTWKLPMYSSGRRLAAEGLVTISIKYAVNHFATIFSGKPVTHTLI